MIFKMNNNYVLSQVSCTAFFDSPKEKIKSNDIGLVTFENNLMFKNERYICDIVIKENDHRNLIKNKLKLKTKIIAQVQDYYNKILTLDIHFFDNYKTFELPVLLTQNMLEKLVQEKYISNFTNQELEKLKDKFSINDGYNECFAYQENEDGINIYSKNGLVLNAIIEDDIYIIKSITNLSQNRPILDLGYGKITFATQKSMIGIKTKKMLSQKEGYIHFWDNYSNLEGEILLETARKIGLIKVENFDVIDLGLRLNLKKSKSSVNAIKSLSIGDQLNFTKEIPKYIIAPKMTWRDYREEIEEEKLFLRSIRNKNKKDTIEKETTVTIKNLDLVTNSITVDLNGIDIKNKKFYLSYKILGNEQQIVRREEARKQIKEGLSAMPHLGAILNGIDINSDLKKDTDVEKLKDLPLSDFVKEKIFSNNPPTDNQLLAIQIALNTPDIAIIQGPPGTGKTTVITGIIERLNEDFEKNSPFSDMAGQVLVTSFQHDAVENMLSRQSVNSLPSIKFGRRSSNSFEEFDMDRNMSIWCSETSKKIKDKNIEIKITQQHSQFKNAYENYRVYQNKNSKLTFLEFAKEIVTNDENLSKDKELEYKISTIIKSLSLDNQEVDTLLNAVITLRVTKEGFKDDGALQSRKLYELLKPIIDLTNDKNYRALEILQKSYECKDEQELKILIEKMPKVRNYLIEQLTPKPFLVKEVFDPEISKIYNQINQRISEIQDPILKIISDFDLELENNRYGVQKAIEEYSFVYGATTQHSTLIQQKFASKKSKTTRLTDEYETVIVDEAARANPGDLLIPLNKASKRIILVGDHRQLPHIYNDEIAEKLKVNMPTSKIDAFEITLFEHLYKVAIELEKKDGIKRAVTLNSQFRMHHVLGDFVNDNFYSKEVLGVDESFKSPLSEEYFKQNLFNFPANWIDVPILKGDEQKLSSSRRRLCEVDVIVAKVKELIQTDEGKKLTYGIITFYSGQVNAIKRALGDELQDVVRVGSVDAFQGMEFDIIFLSTVRTSKNMTKELAEVDEKYAMKLFGFLTVKNRLCVAMSRQKKALIVVGDSKAFDNEISKKYTTPLYNYLVLCSENGGILNE